MPKEPKLFVALPTCGHRLLYAKGMCKECYYREYRKSERYQEYLKNGKASEARKRYYKTTHGAENRRRYRQRDVVRDRALSYNRQKKYGITDGQFDDLLLKQDGRCAICHSDDCKLVVDHCHGSGNIRGLLCHQCNSALGYFSDSPYRLRNAIQYISI